MFFKEATIEDIRHVALNMRERDYDEIVCLGWCENREELAESLALGYSQEENVYCVGTDEDGPIAIICYLPQRKGVWSLGLFATDDFLKVGAFLTKRIIRDIIPSLDQANAHRVEAHSIDGYEEVHNWLRFLGLDEETTIHGMGRNGEDFKVFSYVRSMEEVNQNVHWRGNGRVH